MKKDQTLFVSCAAAAFFAAAGLTGCARKTDVIFEEELSDSGTEDTKTETVTETPAENPSAPAPSQTPVPEPQPIFVDVCGAVSKPGVIELPAGSRVFEAIGAVGGFLPEAAAGYVNQAQLLTDGQQVYIPTKEEAERGQLPAKSKDGEASEAAEEGRVNLNTADETALGNLSGIGPSKARAIIAYREENGGFSSVEELMNVPGIKEGTFTKIKDDIVVE